MKLFQGYPSPSRSRTVGKGLRGYQSRQGSKHQPDQNPNCEQPSQQGGLEAEAPIPRVYVATSEHPRQSVISQNPPAKICCHFKTFSTWHLPTPTPN